jgi:hypothetical protein
LDREIIIEDSEVSNDRLKYGHHWIERLRELPQYRPVVDKLLQGWSLDAVTDWVLEQTDRGPLSDLARSTIRSYMNALNIRLKELARERRANERTRRAEKLAQIVDDFTSGIASVRGDTAREPEPTEEEIKAMQDQDLKSLIDTLTSDKLVRLMLKKHLPYIERLEEMEESSNEPVNGWERSMDVLNDAATILQKNEIAQKLFDLRMQPCIPISEPQLLEESQRIPKLTPLDRQLLRDFGEMYRTMLKRRREEKTPSLKG